MQEGAAGKRGCPGEVIYKLASQLATHKLVRQMREPEDPPVRDTESAGTWPVRESRICLISPEPKSLRLGLVYQGEKRQRGGRGPDDERVETMLDFILQVLKSKRKALYCRKLSPAGGEEGILVC